MAERSKNKVDAIYELRAAAEEKARAEVAADASPGSRSAKDALLEAQLNVEAKTHAAIEVCHECGHEHPPAGHGSAAGAGNVVDVDFRPGIRRDRPK